MNRAVAVPNEARTHFWTVVLACLVEFHQMPRQRSYAKVREFRHKLDEQPNDVAELVYHSEPFDVACRIAEHPIGLKKHRMRYFEIRDVENPLGTDE